jgi:ribA/ribD-fused uncharacterized protein
MNVLSKVISGAQTGADRAGLDAAIRSGIPIGGYCPKGRRAEDGRIPDTYPLEETESEKYPPRTALNIKHADITLLFINGDMTPGSRLTEKMCIDMNKPYYICNLGLHEQNDLALKIISFIAKVHNKKTLTLNIAGSRESKLPGIHDATYKVMLMVIRYLRDWWLYTPVYSMYNTLSAMDNGWKPNIHAFYGVDGDDGVLSQMFPCEFSVHGVTYTSAEQFMHARKAHLFGDKNSQEVILGTTSPTKAKRLGRSVKPFRQKTWNRWRELVVIRGNCYKFAQNDELLQKLLDTKSDLLVEAALKDKIWGCGLDKTHPDIKTPEAWPGKNLLGFSLMAVRRRLSNTDFVEHIRGNK